MAYEPSRIEPKWQAYWEKHETFRAEIDATQAQVLRARHVPLPLRRRPPRRASRGLYRDRHPGALQAHAGLQRPPPDGLGRLRAPRRAVRDQDRYPSAPDDPAQHRELQAPDQEPGLQLRLVPRARYDRSALCEVDPVDLPQALRAGARLSGGGTGQLVSGAGDGARERRGAGRQERGRRPSGRAHADDASGCCGSRSTRIA